MNESKYVSSMGAQRFKQTPMGRARCFPCNDLGGNLITRLKSILEKNNKVGDPSMGIKVRVGMDIKLKPTRLFAARRAVHRSGTRGGRLSARTARKGQEEPDTYVACSISILVDRSTQKA